MHTSLRYIKRLFPLADGRVWEWGVGESAREVHVYAVSQTGATNMFRIPLHVTCVCYD